MVHLTLFRLSTHVDGESILIYSLRDFLKVQTVL